MLLKDVLAHFINRPEKIIDNFVEEISVDGEGCEDILSRQVEDNWTFDPAVSTLYVQFKPPVHLIQKSLTSGEALYYGGTGMDRRSGELVPMWYDKDDARVFRYPRADWAQEDLNDLRDMFGAEFAADVQISIFYV